MWKGKGKPRGNQVESGLKQGYEQEEVFPNAPINAEQVLEALKATRELDVNLHGKIQCLRACVNMTRLLAMYA